MTQEQKELLLKDLCTRLPYGVKVFYEYVDSLNKKTYGYSLTLNTWCIDEMKAEKAVVKPYLFPPSSMSEEQKEEYCSLQQKVIYNNKGLVNSDVMEYINWCYKNHIDINNLIPIGLAIDATGLNIY